MAARSVVRRDAGFGEARAGARFGRTVGSGQRGRGRRRARGHRRRAACGDAALLGDALLRRQRRHHLHARQLDGFHRHRGAGAGARVRTTSTRGSSVTGGAAARTGSAARARTTSTRGSSATVGGGKVSVSARPAARRGAPLPPEAGGAEAAARGATGCGTATGDAACGAAGSAAAEAAASGADSDAGEIRLAAQAGRQRAIRVCGSSSCTRKVLLAASTTRSIIVTLACTAPAPGSSGITFARPPHLHLPVLADGHDKLHAQRVDAGQAQQRLVVHALAGGQEAFGHHAVDRAADHALLQLRRRHAAFFLRDLPLLAGLGEFLVGELGFGARLLQRPGSR